MKKNTQCEESVHPFRSVKEVSIKNRSGIWTRQKLW